jgi:hypothetical protein
MKPQTETNVLQEVILCLFTEHFNEVEFRTENINIHRRS